MKRLLLVATAAFFVLHACSEAGIQLIDESTKKLVDDLLTIKGEVCTTSPEDVVFPVKIMLIVDGSGSMQFTDPSNNNTTTTYTGGVPSYGANAKATCLSTCSSTSTPAATCQQQVRSRH